MEKLSLRLRWFFRCRALRGTEGEKFLRSAHPVAPVIALGLSTQQPLIDFGLPKSIVTEALEGPLRAIKQEALYRQQFVVDGQPVLSIFKKRGVEILKGQADGRVELRARFIG